MSGTAGIKRVAVVGAGQMGGGIAQTVAAIAKLPVTLFDSNSDQLSRQKSFIGIAIAPSFL
jgi:3-hydroxyacyl-CoA dehydrogenase